MKEYLTGTPPKVYDVEAAGADEAERDALPIGGRLAGQAEGGRELLEGLRALERLYETRIGAAERLLASCPVTDSARSKSKLGASRWGGCSGGSL